MLKLDEQQRARCESSTHTNTVAAECCTDRHAARHLRLNQLILVRSGRASASASSSSSSPPFERAGFTRSAIGPALDSAISLGSLARLVSTTSPKPTSAAGAPVCGARRFAPLVQLVRASPMGEGQGEELRSRAASSLLWSRSCREHLSSHQLNESSLRAAESVLGLFLRLVFGFPLFVHKYYQQPRTFTPRVD